MPGRERERSFDDLYREARTSEGRARQQERIRQLDAQRRREAQQSIDEASRRDPPSGGSGVPARGRHVFDEFDPSMTIEPIRVRDLIAHRASDPRCECAECFLRRAEQDITRGMMLPPRLIGERGVTQHPATGSCMCAECRARRRAQSDDFDDRHGVEIHGGNRYAVATDSGTVQWSNRPGEAAPLTLEALRREYARIPQRAVERRWEAEVWIENPPERPVRVQSQPLDVCSLAKGCSGYCATCTRCLQHCTCQKAPPVIEARRIRL